MSIKVLALGDIHLRGEGIDTPEAEALGKVISIARQREVNLILVNGDVFDKDSTPGQRLAFDRFLRDCLDFASVSVIRGNHDAISELAIWDERSGRMGSCSIAQYPTQHTFSPHPDYKGFITVFQLPHCNPAQVASQCGTLTEAGEAGHAAFDALLANWADRIQEHPGPSLVQFHGTVVGAMLDNGYIPRHNGVSVSQGALDALGVPVLCGHYHRFQKVGQQAWDTGSLTRQNFGESEGDKGVLLLEWDGEHWGEPEFVSLNPTRMVLIEAAFGTPCNEDKNGFTILTPQSSTSGLLMPCLDDLESEDYRDAQVRFRYRIKVEDLPCLDLAPVNEMFRFAKELKIERVVDSQGVARCPEIVESHSVEDGLKVWLESGGHDPIAYIHEYRAVVHGEVAHASS